MGPTYDILLKNASYLTPDMELASGDIAMSGGRIAALLPANSGVPADRVLTGNGLLWMPDWWTATPTPASSSSGAASWTKSL